MQLHVEFGGEVNQLNLGSLLGMTTEKMREFNELVGAQMVDSTEERFNTQMSPDGVRWLPSQRAIVQNGETLRDTGRLKTSLTYIPLPDGVEWGTNVYYAPVHQYGAHITPKRGEFLKFVNAYGVTVFARSVTIPARPYLGVDAQDINEISDILAYILERDS